VLEHRLNLLPLDAGKPFQELVNGCTCLEVLEEGLDRCAGSLEEPDSADRALLNISSVRSGSK